MCEKKKFNWIRDDIEVNINVKSKVLENTIKEAEELDLAKDKEYFCVADAIDMLCKNYCTEGLITKKEWELMQLKYPNVD